MMDRIERRGTTFIQDADQVHRRRCTVQSSRNAFLITDDPTPWNDLTNVAHGPHEIGGFGVTANNTDNPARFGQTAGQMSANKS
jgi:hypothetical protein